MNKRFRQIGGSIRTLALTLSLASASWTGSSLFCERSYSSIIIDSNPFADIDQYGLSPYWNWQVIESESFQVIYPKELEKIADRATHYLEEAHQTLSPELRWKPHYKPLIVLIDNEDAANGLTTPLGRFGIILWATPPDSWFSTTYYYDWLRLLIFHEYTHFLNMDKTEGLWAPLRYVFGDSLLPNATWPPWMLEGLAVYMETRFTQAGRGRSPYYEMVLRSAVEQGVLGTPDFITLDKVNGTNPYYPKGDTRYQFGYHLMNQITRQKTNGTTADGKTPTSGKDDLLGIMSDRSGTRVPFFINGNLENITGKSWYDLWNEWVDDTKKRMTDELKIIRSQPITHYKYLTENDIQISNEVMGAAVSPNGKWLAYSSTSADRRPGLYLRNLDTGEVKHLNDKLYGIGLSFTPDSKAIVSSELNRRTQYYVLSDLKIYDIEQDKQYDLTNWARARDPDVSPDGKWVTFTITEAGVTGLAIAPMMKTAGKYSLGEIEKLYMPPLYDRVSNPKFSPDGTKIIFSIHPNGKSQEDLIEMDIKTRQQTVLVANGKYNNYPAFDLAGSLYYISNLTGVDNLYRFNAVSKKSQMVTNMTSGIGFPTFGPTRGIPTFVTSQKESQLYASVFSYTGWNLAEVELLKEPIVPKNVTLPPPPAPEAVPSLAMSPSTEAKADDKIRQAVTYTGKDYSSFSTLSPRSWTPLLGIDTSGVSAGAQILGFDTVNRHRYFGAATYSSNLNVFDGYALYSNRSLGPVLNLSANMLTTNVNSITRNNMEAGISYTRQLDIAASAAYPILWTYSSLTPSIAFDLQRLYAYYQPNSNFPNQNFRLPTETSLTGTSPFVPTFDSVLSYSKIETSGLAVGPEVGRFSQIGTRYYFGSVDPVFKLLGSYQEYIRVSKHTILNPSIKGTWVTQPTYNLTSANSILSGRTLQQVLNPFVSNNFNQLTVRGYPGKNFVSRASLVSAIDLKFPIARIFRGWGTNPVFLDNLYGLVYGELSSFPFSSAGYLLPSAGVGLRLDTEIFFFPITVSAEFQNGFNKSAGGVPDLFFQVLASGFSF